MTISRFRTVAAGAVSAIIVWGLTLVAGATIAYAQPDGEAGAGTPGVESRVILDGIAAVVGNEIILVSDILQRAVLMAQRGAKIDPRDPEIQQELLNSLINEKLVLVRAQEDSIEVSNDEVTQAVESQIEQLKRQAGSIEALERAYNMSIQDIRQEARPLILQQLMIDRIRRQRFSGLKLTERDLDEYYRQYKDSLPELPEQVEIAHIMLLAKPSAESRQTTIALARAIIDSIKNGSDFADFAKRYSTDPGSASKGGELGFVGKGKFVKEYERAADTLGINEFSPPVESKFGIHIIQVLDRRDEEVRSRHILLPLKQTDAEKEQLIDTLQKVRAQALAGTSFSDLAQAYSQDEESAPFGGTLGKFQESQIPENFKTVINNLEVGGISEPQPIKISPTESGYHIVKLVRRIAPHKLDPIQDREQLEILAENYKQTQELLNWITELRKEIYWDIKYDFQ